MRTYNKLTTSKIQELFLKGEKLEITIMQLKIIRKGISITKNNVNLIADFFFFYVKT